LTVAIAYRAIQSGFAMPFATATALIYERVPGGSR
jgi:hypothetical protein